MKIKNTFSKLICIYILIFNTPVHAQVGGNNSFQFLNLSLSARATSLGGSALPIADDDVALAFQNPSLLNDKMLGSISINHNFHFAEIQHGIVNTAFRISSLKTIFQLGFNYIDYGQFVRTDQFGNNQGSFNARETAVSIGAAREINERIRLGLNIKLGNSRFDQYNAFAIAGDLALTYQNPESLFTGTIVFRNIGSVLSTYTNNGAKLPFEIQMAFSKRFAHLPFRLLVTMHHLNQWDLLYESPVDSDPSIIFGDQPSKTSGINDAIENLFRHMIFGGEFIIGKNENFKLRFGYNHRRKKELSISSFRSLGGFSLGIGFKIYKFSIDYGVGYYHLAGAANHLGIRMKFSEIMKKI